MQYRESVPSPHLRRFIKCFWSLEQAAAEAHDSHEPVLPDGRVEIVFNLADRFRRFTTENRFELQPRTIVAGQMTRNIVIGPSGEVRLFGVRFHAIGGYSFLRLPMFELTDRIVGLDVFAKGTILEDQILNANGFQRRVEIFEAAMAEGLTGAKPVDKMFEKSLTAFATVGENESISRLAASFGLNERKLLRDFKKYVGVSPKLFSRINRFASIVRALESDGPRQLLDHAHTFGYYDQSHMINEFRSFSGQSPTAFYRRSHKLSEFFTVGE